MRGAPYRTAGALLLLLAQPLVTIVALRVDAVHDSPAGMTIELGTPPTSLPEPFADLLRSHLRNRPDLATGNADNPWMFKLGTWGAAPIEGAEPVGDEIVLDRIRMSAFNGTSLDPILRNLGITTVVVVGVWTNMAVEHTVRDAADHGYEAVIVSDATSSINGDWQAAALGYALTNIATIATTDEVVTALSA